MRFKGMDSSALVELLFITDGFMRTGLVWEGSCHRWDRKPRITDLYKERRFVLFMVKDVEGHDPCICDEGVIHDRWHHNGSVPVGRSHHTVRQETRVSLWWLLIRRQLVKGLLPLKHHHIEVRSPSPRGHGALWWCAKSRIESARHMVLKGHVQEAGRSLQRFLLKKWCSHSPILKKQDLAADLPC